MSNPDEPLLTRGEQDTLLQVARMTLERHVRRSERMDLAGVERTAAMEQARATFVTLRERNGDLRGCIGSTAHCATLLESVQENVIRSAKSDPRFNPVAPDEVSELSIEISALGNGDAPDSPFRRLKTIEDLVIGRDGVYMVFEGKGRGLLLPQVATERGWDTRQFLKALCAKSGLNSEAWEDPRAEIHRFSAQVFGEV